MEARHRIHEGYLYKKGVYNKAWKKRYFVLYRDRTIQYFKDKLSSAKRQNAKGNINLTQIEKVELIQSAESDVNKFQIQLPLINSPDHSFESFDSYSNNNTLSPPLSPISISRSPSPSPSPSVSVISSSSFSNSARDRSKSDNNLCGLLDDDDEKSTYGITTNVDIKSELQSDKKYSFALVSSSRNWILCAETIKNLKQFLSKLVPLTQGDKMYENESFTLYKHKLIKYENEYIDLTNVCFLRADTKNECIEIGVSRDKQIKLCTLRVIESFDHIKSLFGDSFSLKYHSLISKVHIVHKNKVIQNQFVGLYRDYIVIFAHSDKKRFSLFENTIFCSKMSFREYSKLQNYILIPFNAHTKIRKASKKHGKHCFFVSTAGGNVRYYFCVKTEQILSEWLLHLLPKRVFNKSPRPKKLRMVKSATVKSLKSKSICLLSPIADDETNSVTDGFPEIIPIFGDFSSAQSAFAD